MLKKLQGKQSLQLKKISLAEPVNYAARKQPKKGDKDVVVSGYPNAVLISAPCFLSTLQRSTGAFRRQCLQVCRFWLAPMGSAELDLAGPAVNRLPPDWPISTSRLVPTLELDSRPPALFVR